ncbi:RICIN domain-containing protein [Kitasatospora sp. NPDC004669]|uniref:RICIN domain-containing protein n=1 Tax=Kitasatospora sp. NPDC004669 TaxID=3154555 RepID=UPI0033AB5A3E
MMITWTATGRGSQLWQFLQQPDGSYELKYGKSGMCADVSGGSTTAEPAQREAGLTVGSPGLVPGTRPPMAPAARRRHLRPHPRRG